MASVRLVFPGTDREDDKHLSTVLVGLGSGSKQRESAASMEPDATMIGMTDGLHQSFVSLVSI